MRDPNTIDALRTLVEGGYIADDDGAGLGVAYRWLRNVEHRLQLWQERQVRHLPADDEGLTRLARVMGFKDSPSASRRRAIRKRTPGGAGRCPRTGSRSSSTGR